MGEVCAKCGAPVTDEITRVCEHCNKTVILQQKSIIPFDPVGGSFVKCPECGGTIYIPPTRR